jgi:PucR C-terminal helix-turn-helix domain/GGDEF-like domain
VLWTVALGTSVQRDQRPLPYACVMPAGRSVSTAPRLSDLASNLSANRLEIESLAMTAISRIEPVADGDPFGEYPRGVQRTVEAVVDYVLTCLAAGSTAVVPVPEAALEQARHAAKAGVALDVVLRRYTAGDIALRRILAAELAGFPRATENDAYGIADEAIDSVLRCAAAGFEAEAGRLSGLSNPVLATTLGLLKGEVHVSELDGYVLDRWHIGLVTKADVSRASISRLAADLGAQAFVVDSQTGQRWVWIGRNQPMRSDGVAQAIERFVVKRACFGLGEARRGVAGWRLTHREARIAAELPGADRVPVTRMRRHLLEAAVLDSREFTESLIATYIDPLQEEPPDVAADLRTTLHAYLHSGQNAKSAAELLGIDRHTVVRRLRKVEDLVGERVEDCFAQLDIALRVATIPGGPLTQ